MPGGKKGRKMMEETEADFDRLRHITLEKAMSQIAELEGQLRAAEMERRWRTSKVTEIVEDITAKTEELTIGRVVLLEGMREIIRFLNKKAENLEGVDIINENEREVSNITDFIDKIGVASLVMQRRGLEMEENQREIKAVQERDAAFQERDAAFQEREEAVMDAESMKMSGDMLLQLSEQLHQEVDQLKQQLISISGGENSLSVGGGRKPKSKKKKSKKKKI